MIIWMDVLLGMGFCSVFLLPVAIWFSPPLERWRMKRRAKQMIAQKRAYADAMMENMDRFIRGEISEEQWRDQTEQIARCFPDQVQ